VGRNQDGRAFIVANKRRARGVRAARRRRVNGYGETVEESFPYVLSPSRKRIALHEATGFTGVATQTLRRRQKEKLFPDERAPSGRRRDEPARLRPESFDAPEAARLYDRQGALTRVQHPDPDRNCFKRRRIIRWGVVNEF
jgi:hypothetical protein